MSLSHEEIREMYRENGRYEELIDLGADLDFHGAKFLDLPHDLKVIATGYLWESVFSHSQFVLALSRAKEKKPDDPDR